MYAGVGLVLRELDLFGALSDTLVVYSSDNGVPFAGGRTNSYDSGVGEPLLVSSPGSPESHGTSTRRMASLLDVVPTALEWFNVSYPEYDILHKGQPAVLTGRCGKGLFFCLFLFCKVDNFS